MMKCNWLVLFIAVFSFALGGCETMSGAMRGAQRDIGKAANFLDGKDERRGNPSTETSQYDKNHSHKKPKKARK